MADNILNNTKITLAIIINEQVILNDNTWPTFVITYLDVITRIINRTVYVVN